MNGPFRSAIGLRGAIGTDQRARRIVRGQTDARLREPSRPRPSSGLSRGPRQQLNRRHRVGRRVLAVPTSAVRAPPLTGYLVALDGERQRPVRNVSRHSRCLVPSPQADPAGRLLVADPRGGLLAVGRAAARTLPPGRHHHHCRQPSTPGQTVCPSTGRPMASQGPAKDCVVLDFSSTTAIDPDMPAERTRVIPAPGRSTDLVVSTAAGVWAWSALPRPALRAPPRPSRGAAPRR